MKRFFYLFFCLILGLCTMISVSWYAFNITQVFFDPLYPGTKYVSVNVTFAILFCLNFFLNLSLVFCVISVLQVWTWGGSVYWLVFSYPRYLWRLVFALCLQSGKRWHKVSAPAWSHATGLCVSAFHISSVRHSVCLTCIILLIMIYTMMCISRDLHNLYASTHLWLRLKLWLFLVIIVQMHITCLPVMSIPAQIL